MELLLLYGLKSRYSIAYHVSSDGVPNIVNIRVSWSRSLSPGRNGNLFGMRKRLSIDKEKWILSEYKP